MLGFSGSEHLPTPHLPVPSSGAHPTAGSSSLLSCHPHPPLPCSGLSSEHLARGQGTHRNLLGISKPSLVPHRDSASPPSPCQQQQAAGELCTGHRNILAVLWVDNTSSRQSAACSSCVETSLGRGEERDWALSVQIYQGNANSWKMPKEGGEAHCTENESLDNKALPGTQLML